MTAWLLIYSPPLAYHIFSLSYLRLRGLGMSKIKLDHKGDGAGFWNRKEKEGMSFEGRRSNG